MLQQLQDCVWRRRLGACFARVEARAPAGATPAPAPTAVGFADLAGFTTLTRRSTTAEPAGLDPRRPGMAEALAGEARFALRPRRPESVRGFGHPRQWRLRPAGPAAQAAAPYRRRGRTRGGR